MLVASDPRNSTHGHHGGSMQASIVAFSGGRRKRAWRAPGSPPTYAEGRDCAQAAADGIVSCWWTGRARTPERTGLPGHGNALRKCARRCPRHACRLAVLQDGCSRDIPRRVRRLATFCEFRLSCMQPGNECPAVPRKLAHAIATACDIEHRYAQRRIAKQAIRHSICRLP